MVDDNRSVMVKYDFNTIKVLLHRILNGPDSMEKSKLIEMLAYYTYDSEQFCRKVMDVVVGNMVPEPIRPGTRVVINASKSGWLSSSDKEILDKATKNDVTYGIVLKFNGYHGYSNYEIGFPDGTVQLTLDAVSNMEVIV
jgi:hypothetical protein